MHSFHSVSSSPPSSPSSYYFLSSAASSSFSLPSASSRNSYDSSSASDFLDRPLPPSFNEIFPSSPNCVYEDNYEGLFAEPADYSGDIENTLSPNAISNKIKIYLDSLEPGSLAGAVENLIGKSDHFKEKFVFNSVKGYLKNLLDLPEDLLKVLKSMVNDATWIKNDEIRDELQKMLSDYEKIIPHIYLAEMEEIYKTLNEKKDELARSSNSDDEAELEEICKQGKDCLHKISAFFEKFHNDSQLADLIVKPLIGSAVSFIASQYLFPSIQRRWK